MRTITKGSKGEEVKTLQSVLHLAQDGIFGSITEEALNEFKKEHSLPEDGICDTRTWIALLPDRLLTAHKRTINEIIVHCTATPEGRDYTVEQIRKQHKAQGWNDIGYHYVVYRDGSVHEGRDVNVAGAHCNGHNLHSIGVVYVGGCDKAMRPKDTRTDAQKESLYFLLKVLKRHYPKATIHGHNEYAAKACPSFNVKEEYIDL